MASISKMAGEQSKLTIMLDVFDQSDDFFVPSYEPYMPSLIDSRSSESTLTSERRQSDQDTLDDFDHERFNMMQIGQSSSWDTQSTSSELDSTRTTPDIIGGEHTPLSPLSAASTHRTQDHDTPPARCMETSATLTPPTLSLPTSKPKRSRKSNSRRTKTLKKASKVSPNRSNSRQQFWTIVWPKLEAEGWTLEPGKRKRDNDFYFYPPNTDRATARYRIDYFDSVRLVLSMLEQQGQHTELLEEYYKHEPAPKPPARESKREVKALLTETEPPSVYRGRGKRSSRKVVKYDPSVHFTIAPKKPRVIQEEPTPVANDQDSGNQSFDAFPNQPLSNAPNSWYPLTDQPLSEIAEDPVNQGMEPPPFAFSMPDLQFLVDDHHRQPIQQEHWGHEPTFDQPNSLLPMYNGQPMNPVTERVQMMSSLLFPN